MDNKYLIQMVEEGIISNDQANRIYFFIEHNNLSLDETKIKCIGYKGEILFLKLSEYKNRCGFECPDCKNHCVVNYYGLCYNCTT
jgi:hypothetical protein